MRIRIGARRHLKCCEGGARPFRSLATVGALLFAVAGPARGATKAFWVAPDGDDSNAGTEAAPFRTPQRALEASAEAGSGESVRVTMADGTYRLERPLQFDSKRFGLDGPSVTFASADGASPTLSGAVKVTAWELVDAARHLYRAAVGSADSRQLYVGGRRAIRARTDLSGGLDPSGFLPSPVLPEAGDPPRPFEIGGGIQYLPTTLNPESWRDPAKWRGLSGVEAIIETQWKMMIVPLSGLTPPKGTSPGLLSLVQPAWTNANLFFQTKPGSCEPDRPGIWSFWQVTRFENALEFLDEPGEFYLDRSEPGRHQLYYIPRAGEDLAKADVELPVLETLVEGIGSPEAPVANLTFEDLTFAYATWLQPGGPDGYVADQSGMLVLGPGRKPNVVGHVEEVERTHGNVRFAYARNLRFARNRFLHLGGAALDLGPGTQEATIVRNSFQDISAAAIQLGGVGKADARPTLPGMATRRNRIENNLIAETGRDYVDSAAIFIGFTSETEVRHNTIAHVPWAGIAIGWGWGLLDAGSFPGLPCARSGEWGAFSTVTANSRNTIAYNRITHFLENRWDGGAIYSTGQQGTSADDPLLIEGNVADHKGLSSGGNTFYTDGGSRYVVLRGNVSYENPIGRVDLGPPSRAGDPLPPLPLAAANVIPYGGDAGGCRTYGDIRYEGNFWREGLIPLEEKVLAVLSAFASRLLRINPPIDLYSRQGFFNVCPFVQDGTAYPTRLSYAGNHSILGEWEVPRSILARAGVQPEAEGVEGAAATSPR